MAKLSLFDSENAFWSFLNKLFNLAYAGILWFVTSLPLFTIGASTTALYTYCFAVVNNSDGYVGRTFFRAFKLNFVKATKLWLMMVVLFGFLFLDAYLASTVQSVFFRFLFFIIVGIALILAIFSVHTFAFLSQNNIPLKRLYKQVLLLGVGKLPLSITLVVINILYFVGIYAFPPIMIIGQGFVAVLCSLFLRGTYHQILELE